MKIVYLNPSAQLGGAEKVLLDLLASLKAAEPALALHLLVPAEGPLAARAKALGVAVLVLPFPPALARLGDSAASVPAGRQFSRLSLTGRLLSASFAALIYLLRLRRVLRKLSPDLIHTNGFKMHLLGLWAKPARVPVVWHIHDYVSARPLMSLLLKRCARRCAAIIAVSQSVAADVRTLCGAAAPIHTVYNAIDLDYYAPTGPRLDLDSLAGLPPASPPETIRIGLLATMARWKGHEVFLQALTRLPKTLPWRAYIVGGALYETDGSQYSITELRELAAQLGLAQHVGFTGFVAEPAAAIRACDIIVHASTQPEPFGLVIVEAMACGRAVIVSRAGGAAELVAPGRDALTHLPGDAAELAARIVELADKPHLRAALGAHSVATAARHFARGRLVMDLLPIYRRVVAPRLAESPVATLLLL